MTENEPLELQVGGAVPLQTGVYIVRQSDRELLSAIQQGEYCNVLCPRQMGKTSMVLRLRDELRKQAGYRTALVDIAGRLGTPATGEEWYLGLLGEIAYQCQLAPDVKSWWAARSEPTANQKLLAFFREEMLARFPSQRFVVFLDEIDHTLNLDYTDDFFLAIRSLYNDRAAEHDLRRLAFCLIGVFTPNELVKQQRTTTYNVGRTFELQDFDPQRDDLAPLAVTLSEDPMKGTTLLDAVLAWTGGHPYLTASACQKVAAAKAMDLASADRAIEHGFLGRERSLDANDGTHFENIARFLGQRVEARQDTVRLYRRLWNGREERDRPASQVVALKLSGLVKVDPQGLLAVRNRIYRRRFNLSWINTVMPLEVNQIEDEETESECTAEPTEPARTPRLYANAKVVLIGESGVGKSGLSARLAKGSFDATISTDGARATPLLLTTAHGSSVEREIWLWDIAGQVDYRLVHQLFMNDAAAAVLVFDPQNERWYEDLVQWDRDLGRSSSRPIVKLLAAGRVDRGGLAMSQEAIQRFMSERDFQSPLHLTSALTGEGCAELKEAIVTAIDWSAVPLTSTPELYKRLKDKILRLRDDGLRLIQLPELNQRLQVELIEHPFTLEELETVIGLLAGPGLIQRLDFGNFVLLRPEILSRYASALVRKVRLHPKELGCISEKEFLEGDLDYQDFERLPRAEEGVILRALLESCIQRAWCFRQGYGEQTIFVFPSYFRRERPEPPQHPNVLVTYRFDGAADDIYATLVVRLHHTPAFEALALWKNTADFQDHAGGKLGLALHREAEGAARLEVYFEPGIGVGSQATFLRYAHEHLQATATNVRRLRQYYCSNAWCDSRAFPIEQGRIDKAMAAGKSRVFCPDCGQPIPLRDKIEEKFDSPELQEEIRQQQEASAAAIDNESLELILVGHVYAITGEAGQIYRGYTNSDHGIDGEIEFKNDSGLASGLKCYLQLKSGDSYLLQRKRDQQIFRIKQERWASYWQAQAYPVMLVMRTSDGQIRWMNLTEYLKRETARQGRLPRQIEFEGERFDAYTVRQMRDRVLRAGR